MLGLSGRLDMKNPLIYWNELCEWWDRRPDWMQLLLLPIVFVLTMIFLAFTILVILPCFAIVGYLKYRRTWRRLRESGRVTKWFEVAPAVALKAGTLVVEVGPKGPACLWWIDRPRAEIDPDNIVPSWLDFEELEWRLFQRKADVNRVEQWAINRLAAYESSAHTVAPGPWWSRLSRLGGDTKRDAVLVMWYESEGCLSRTLMEEMQ
jgi:hypothetical protein